MNDDDQISAQLEAILMCATEPLTTEILAQVLGLPEHKASEHLEALSRFYDQTNRGFMLRNIAHGWQYATRPEHYELISAWVIEGQQNRLSQAALETLAVIAYAQPTSRSKVSAVRGVNVDGVVRTLIARGLVEEIGHDRTTGAGLLTTTPYFLQRLGLASLDELPPIAPHLPEASDLELELARISQAATESEEKENNG